MLPAVIADVGHVTFVYGQHDWMTIEAAVEIAQAVNCKAFENAGGRLRTEDQGLGTKPTPRVEIYRLGGAGHSFLVDNPLAMADAILRSMDVSQVHVRPKTRAATSGAEHVLSYMLASLVPAMALTRRHLSRTYFSSSISCSFLPRTSLPKQV